MLKIISHIVLSSLMLFSATGMTVNMHFCQGHLYDLAFNVPAHDCCENETGHHCCHQDHDTAKEHHCNNESIKIESSRDYICSSFTYNFADAHSFELLSAAQVIPESFVAQNFATARILNYKRPPPQEVVLSQIQSFLI